MSDNKKTQSEDLKKLEDQAYYELCQIIAEAMQYQDVGLLDSRIAAWKSKYKKLLDESPSNSSFKKRIEFLLTQYYSDITQYILGQLKLKEEKKIENQSKALRQLYSIIRDTNDLDLLKKKVKEWQDKYPVSGFLRMYQKRIELYTREKNLKENAFEQEKAFSDLIDITKIHGTIDELKEALHIWEEKYSINDKYTIDDFIKHQSEVKRFTSDEFLISIARDEETNDVDKNDIDIVEEYNNKSSSTLPLQAKAYSTLLAIASKANNVNELFDWVYKNRYIKFNDKYKELILSATYLNYRPEYLNHLTIPDVNVSKSSLSFDEYKNIDEIKRYAIISYFNLLLPPDKAMSNDYFNKHIQTIYSKSEKARNSTNIKDESTSIGDVFDSGIEISFKNPTEISDVTEVDLQQEEQSDEGVVITETSAKETTDIPEVVIDLSDTESGLTITLENKNKPNDVSKEIQLAVEDLPESTDASTETKIDEKIYSITDEQEEKDNSESNIEFFLSTNEPEKETIKITSDVSDSTHESYQEESIDQLNKAEDSEETLNYDTIIAFSPLLFEAINNYNKQAILINHIDSAATRYVESERSKSLSLDEPANTKYDLE